MSDPIEKEVKAIWDHVRPSPEIRDDVLAGLGDDRLAPRSRRGVAVLALCVLAGIAGAAYLLRSEPVRPAALPVVATATSEDGAWKLEINHVWLDPFFRGHSLCVTGRVLLEQPDLELAIRDPLSRYVTGDGVDRTPEGHRQYYFSGPGEFSLHDLPVPADRKIARLDLDFTILEMKTGALRFEVADPGSKKVSRLAPPWELRIYRLRGTNLVAIDFEVTEAARNAAAPGPYRSALSAIVRDADGAPLRLSTAGNGGATYEKEGGPVVWPITIRLADAKPLSAAPVRFTLTDLGPASLFPPSWTEYGPPVRGLAIRTRAPHWAEEGVRLPVTVEFLCEKAGLPEGTVRLASPLHELFLALELTPEGGGAAIRVDPDDPTAGMFEELREADGVPLRRGPVQRHEVEFPLAPAGAKLPPGRYEARVVYSFPDLAERWHGTVRGLDMPGAWRGTVRSEPFPLDIVEQPFWTRTVLLPKKLRVEKGLRLVFAKEDAEEVVLPARNGYSLGALFYRGDGNDRGSLYGLGGVPEPDGPNAVAQYAGHEGPIHETITIEVYHVCVPSGHLEWPGPGKGGFEVLWKRTFPVDLTAEEVEALR